MQEQRRQNRQGDTAEKINQFVQLSEFASGMIKVDHERQQKPCKEVICQLRTALLEEDEQANRQIHQPDECQVESTLEMLIAGNDLEVDIVNRMLDSVDLLQYGIAMHNRVPRVVPYSLFFQIARERFRSSHFLVVQASRSGFRVRWVVTSNVKECPDVVALLDCICERRIRADRLGLNAIGCIDPLDSVVGNGWKAQPISEIEDADNHKRDSYRQNGDKLGRTGQFLHLSKSLRGPGQGGHYSQVSLEQLVFPLRQCPRANN